jgi:hypothetical protein
LAKLKKYKRKHGNCNVPQGWAEDPRLGTWVRTQRTCKKALDRGDPSEGMTVGRAARLEALGFTWARSKSGAALPNEAAWEAQLARLAAYKAAYGDCNVLRRWAEEPPLGRWIGKQRVCKKALDRGDPSPGITAARAAKLEALGFAWALSAATISEHQSEGQRDDAGWEAQLAKLKKYKRKHGNCNVPQSWAEDARLGTWVRTQRTCKKALDRGDPSPGMTVGRAARLEALGFAWARSKGGAALPNEAAWEAQLARLAVYKEAHGDCSVPKGWAEDPRLGRWVMSQRAYKKALDRGDPSERMTAARAAKLEALGFAWALSAATMSKHQSEGQRNDASWEAQLAKLKKYTREHGDCNVPQGWAEDLRLGRWVMSQRAYKKALDRGDTRPGITAAQVAKLEAIGFAWKVLI